MLKFYVTANIEPNCNATFKFQLRFKSTSAFPVFVITQAKLPFKG